jgi:hypothetical protein
MIPHRARPARGQFEFLQALGLEKPRRDPAACDLIIFAMAAGAYGDKEIKIACCRSSGEATPLWGAPANYYRSQARRNKCLFTGSPCRSSISLSSMLIGQRAAKGV